MLSILFIYSCKSATKNKTNKPADIAKANEKAEISETETNVNQDINSNKKPEHSPTDSIPKKKKHNH